MERFERLERLELFRIRYLNCGITFSANRRMFLSAISCGMPPKWNVPEIVVRPVSSAQRRMVSAQRSRKEAGR